MKTVKALQTLHGSYGLKQTGETLTVHNSVADQLIANNLVELVEEGGEDTKTAQAQDEENTVAKNAELDKKTAKKAK